MTLLSPQEPEAFESFEGADANRVILVCDHASNRVPEALAGLGLPPERLQDHIAWDIGAGAVARALQARFRAGAVIAGYSRLVVDLNRSPADASAMPAISDGVLVPGNLGLSPADRQARTAALFEPYHAEIERLLDTTVTATGGPVFLGIHSFTPHFHGTRRPWHVGVLWDKDPRLAVPILAYLRAVPGIHVGDNEPYSGRHPADYSIDHHAETRGIAHVGIEIRQDLIDDAAGQARWIALIGAALAAALDDPAVFERRSYGVTA